MLVFVHEMLLQALQPVLRDLAVTGAPMPEIRDEDWAGRAETPSVMLWGEHHGSGVLVVLDEPEQERIVRVADGVQEWVIDELWLGLAPTNWPACPDHPNAHPLWAAVHDGVTAWVCPTDGEAHRSVGGLPVA